MKVLAMPMLSSANSRAFSAEPNPFAAESWRAASCQAGGMLLRPELHSVGLFRRPRGSSHRRRSSSRCSRAHRSRWSAGRRARPELVGALQNPRLGLGVLREDRGSGRDPDAGRRDRPIGVRRVVPSAARSACTAAAICSPSARPRSWPVRRECPRSISRKPLRWWPSGWGRAESGSAARPRTRPPRRRRRARAGIARRTAHICPGPN